MTENPHSKKSSAIAILGVLLALLLFVGSFIVSIRFDKVWLAFIGFAVGSTLFAILARDNDNPKKTAGSGFGLFVVVSLIWMLVYFLVRM